LQGGAGPPFRNPPAIRDVLGASGASLRVRTRRLGGPGKTDSHARRSRVLRPPPPLVRAGWPRDGTCSWSVSLRAPSAPPLRNPPAIRDVLGASGASLRVRTRRLGDPGKTDSHARRSRVLRPPPPLVRAGWPRDGTCSWSVSPRSPWSRSRPPRTAPPRRG